MGLYNLINGENPKKDFTNNSLPKNRRELFIFLFKNNFWELVKVSLLTFLFFIPLLLWDFSFNAYILSAEEILKEIDPTLIPTQKLILKAIFGLVQIPLFIIATIGLSGAIGIIQKLIYDEVTIFKYQFFHSIKENWKRNIGYSLFVSIPNLFMIINFYFFQSVSLPSFIEIFNLVIIFFVLLVGIFMYLYSMVQNNIYTLINKKLIKNSFLFSIILFPKNLIISFLALLPFIIMNLAQLLGVKLFLICLIMFILLSYSVIIVLLFLNSIFDKYIHSYKKKDFVNKGLRR